MDFARLLEIVGDEPVFETGLILAGVSNPDSVRQQLSRWVRAGQLYQLRRGVYALAPPFQKTKPHPFRLANQLVRNSYVSLQSALAHYNLIPEFTPVTTSVTSSRPASWDTPLGSFTFRHIKIDLFYGYERVQVAPQQFAFVASPEKALLDLVHLTPYADHTSYLQELRLQNLEQLDLEKLCHFAAQSRHPKLERAAHFIVERAKKERSEFQTL